MRLFDYIQKHSSILRKHESVDGCELCGEKHALSYGGQYYCRDKDHIAHGPYWSQPPEAPMTDAELEDLHAQIKREKNENYSGGYLQWCIDRKIPVSKR